jgi:hypothetical protein
MFQPDIASDIERMLHPSICIAKASEHGFKDLDEKSEIISFRRKHRGQLFQVELVAFLSLERRWLFYSSSCHYFTGIL